MFLNCLSALLRFAARATGGTRTAAPALVFHADAVTPTERRSGTMTPWPLKAETERMIAPRLRGSVMPSRATKMGGALEMCPLLPLGEGFLGEVVSVLVFVRRDLQNEALVDGVLCHAVQLSLAGFEQGGCHARPRV